MEFVRVVEPPAAGHLLQEGRVVAVGAEAVAEGLLQGGRRDRDIEVGHVGDQVDVVLVGADRLHGCPQRGRALQIDCNGPQHRIVGAGEACADTFIPLLRQGELGSAQFQGLALSRALVSGGRELR